MIAVCTRWTGSWTRHEPTVARVALSVPECVTSCHCMPEPVEESSEQDQTGNETTGAFGSPEWSFLLHTET